MKLEQQVCILELAQKLKELGVRQESLFWYIPVIGGGYQVTLMQTHKSSKGFSAFTIGELGGMLLSDCLSRKTRSAEFSWRCECESASGYITASGADTEADARAKMLVYLLENKLITL